MNHYAALQLAHRWLIAARTADKIGGDELAEDMAEIEGALALHPDEIGDKPIPYEDLFAKFVRVRGQYIQEINMTSLLAGHLRLAVTLGQRDEPWPKEAWLLQAASLAQASENGRACPTLLDEAVDAVAKAWDGFDWQDPPCGSVSVEQIEAAFAKLKEARTGAPQLLPARDSLWAATAAIKFLVAVVDECGKQVMLDLGTCRKIDTARELAQKLEAA